MEQYCIYLRKSRKDVEYNLLDDWEVKRYVVERTVR
jgi:hypothetical protein